MKTIGVILASGRGERTTLNIPKQFVKVHGRPVIEYTIDAFKSANIPLIISIPPEYDCENISKNWNATIIKGGNDRTTTIRNVIEELKKVDAEYVIFHDAARPMITPETLFDIQSKLQAGHDVILSIDKITDSLSEIFSNEGHIKLLDRDNYRLVQTPESFRINKLIETYENYNGTSTLIAGPLLNDPSLLLHEINKYNFKITYKSDIRLIEKLLTGSNIMPKAERDINILKGKNILIFGGTGGIGTAFIEELKKSFGPDYPYSKYITSFNSKNNFDLSKLDWSNQLVEKYKNITQWNYIVYAAGLCYPDTDITNEQRQDMFMVNAFSVQELLKIAPKIMPLTGGNITIIGSSSSTMGRSKFGLYSASKMSANALVQSYASYLDKHSINVNCLCPTKTRTKMVETTMTDSDKEYILEADEVARAIINSLIVPCNGQTWYMYKGLEY